MPWYRDKDGNPVWVDEVQQEGGWTPNPTAQYAGQQAEADLRNANLNARSKEVSIEAQRQAMNAPPAGFRWTDGGNLEPIPGGPSDPTRATAASRPSITAKERADAIRAYFDADAIDRTVAHLKRQYKAGPGSTKGIWGVRDYFPTAQNDKFDDTGKQARGAVKRAKGFTGGEGNTLGESDALYGPYLPKASDKDEAILNKIKALEELAVDARRTSAAILGGIPDANGNISPFESGPRAAGYGATEKSTPIPPEMQAEYDAYLAANPMPNPDEYAAFRDQLDQKYRFQANTPEQMEANREWARNAGKNPNAKIPDAKQDMSRFEQFRNNLVSSPTGTMVAQAANMGGFGIPEAFDPAAFQAINEENPNASMIGQIGGAITGTGILGAAGRKATSMVLPSLLSNGRRGAQFGRNLATDMAYSGIYGANTGDDPLNSAVMGGIGSVAGQGATGLLGATTRGIRASAPVRAMRDAGVPLTVGQVAGGIPKAIEDASMSIPGIGDVILNRRTDAFEGFNRAAFREAGAPIGANINGIQKEGLDSLSSQISDAYDNAIGGVSVPYDRQFQMDGKTVKDAIANLASDAAPDRAASLQKIIDLRVNPMISKGKMTGPDYQQAIRGLKAARGNVNASHPGFEEPARDAITLAMDAIRGNMERGGGQSVVDGLARADDAYRNFRVLDDATTRAAGGSQSGETFMFTPSQLQRAGIKSAQKYPGRQPFEALADAGQQVLPSQLPDSGTAKRAATGLLGNAALGGGLGYYAGDQNAESAIQGATLAGLLMAGGSAPAQKIMTSGLLDRTARLQQLGELIERQQRIGGAAALPMLIGH